MGARLDEALWWKSNWSRWSLDDCCHVTSALGTLRSKGQVITIAFFFGRKLHWAWNRQKEIGTWWNEGDWGGKRGDCWEHPSPIGKLMSLKKSCCWWKTSQPDDGKTGEENRTRDQSIKKPSNLDWGQGRKNRDWWRKEGFVQRGTWMIRDLVRIRCYVVFQESNCHGQLPCRLPGALRARETDLRLPAGFWLLELHWLGFLLIASSLLPLLCPCLARLARLGALCSAFCRSSLFPLERFGRLGHQWCGVNCRRSRRRLVRVVLVEWADELSKMLDCWD